MDLGGVETNKADVDPWPAEPQPTWRGVSPNFFILIAACIGLGAALALAPQVAGPLTFLFIAAGWILSVVIHEFGHAFVAYKAGDFSVVRKGYLTLDPLKYTDLGVTLVLPLVALALGGIGFPGAAVYLRPDLMRSRIGRSLASLAGPAMTGVVLLVLALGLRMLPTATAPALYCALALLAFLQATALILNLLPVPGLDGYGVLRPFIPMSVQRSLRPIERLSMLALMAALFLVPGASDQLFLAAFAITDALGIPRGAVGAGFSLFQFWKSIGSPA